MVRTSSAAASRIPRRRTSAPLDRAVASRSIAAEIAATRSGQRESRADAGCIRALNHTGIPGAKP
jgi:hypothetical protein